MNVLRSIDWWILDRVQAVSDFVHYWTGWDCLLQTRIVRGVSALCWLLVVVVNIHDGRGFDWVSSILILTNLHALFFDSYANKKIRRDAELGLRNFRRINTDHILQRVGIRLAIGLLLMIPAERELFRILGACILLQQELEACDVQRPTRGRLRDLVSSLGFRPKAVGVEA